MEIYSSPLQGCGMLRSRLCVVMCPEVVGHVCFVAYFVVAVVAVVVVFTITVLVLDFCMQHCQFYKTNCFTKWLALQCMCCNKVLFLQAGALTTKSLEFLSGLELDADLCVTFTCKWHTGSGWCSVAILSFSNRWHCCKECCSTDCTDFIFIFWNIC